MPRKGIRRGTVATCLNGPKDGKWLELTGTPGHIKFKSGAVYCYVGDGEGVSYYQFDVFSIEPVNCYPNPYARVDDVCRRCDGRGWGLNEEFLRRKCDRCKGTGKRKPREQRLEEEKVVQEMFELSVDPADGKEHGRARVKVGYPDEWTPR